VAWSPDGTRIATSGGHGIKIRNSATGQRILEIMTEKIGEIAWSSDGAFIAASGSDTTRIWDSATGLEQRGWGVAEPGSLGIGGYATWSRGVIEHCEGEAWRRLVRVNEDGTFRPFDLPTLSRTPPSDRIWAQGI